MKAKKIPDRWLQGYLRTHPEQSVWDAIAWWVEQERLAEEFEAERRAAEEPQD